MSKNIVVFSDGTGQDGGVRAEQRMSNVYKLYRASRVGPESPINPKAQVSFYDPGLGTETTATGMTDVVRRVQKLLASVSGTGITTNIADCYEFIINHYQPGDRIFLFGLAEARTPPERLRTFLCFAAYRAAWEMTVFRGSGRRRVTFQRKPCAPFSNMALGILGKTLRMNGSNSRADFGKSMARIMRPER